MLVEIMGMMVTYSIEMRKRLILSSILLLRWCSPTAMLDHPMVSENYHLECDLLNVKLEYFRPRHATISNLSVWCSWYGWFGWRSCWSLVAEDIIRDISRSFISGLHLRGMSQYYCSFTLMN
jgi:hypothetical protein